MREARFVTGVALARDNGRGICEGDGVYVGAGIRRSDRRGVVMGLDFASSSGPTITQASSVRNRFGMRGRSVSTESMDRTP